MKIVFQDEREAAVMAEAFSYGVNCPSDIGMKDHSECGEITCWDCWQYAMRESEDVEYENS